MDQGMIATISDGLYALLATGGCFAVVGLVLVAERLRPAQLRSWRDQREVKRRLIAELEQRQEEQLDRMHNTTGASRDEALVRYLELQNSIEMVKGS
jgi:Lon protease-like protein